MTRLAQIKKVALALPAKQRLRLVYDIWDSIIPEADAVTIPVSHRRLLERREREHAANPRDVMTWTEMKRRLVKRRARKRAS